MSDVAENPHAPAVTPTQSMDGAVLVDAPLPATSAVTVPPGFSAPPLEVAENPHAPAVTPTQSMDGAVLVEAPLPAVPAVPGVSAPVPAEPPRAVQKLPRRPRIRASFWYDAADMLTLELTFMDERRNLIHRQQLQAAPGSAFARIFEALLGVSAYAATEAGVFGTRRE